MMQRFLCSIGLICCFSICLLYQVEAVERKGHIKEIKLYYQPKVFQIIIIYEGPSPEYKDFTLTNPARLVIDTSFYNCTLPKVYPLNHPFFPRLRWGIFKGKLRLVIDSNLKKIPTYTIQEENSHMTISIFFKEFQQAKQEDINYQNIEPPKPKQRNSILSNLELSGYIWSKISTDLNKDNEYEDLYEWRNELRLKGKGKLNDKVEIFASVDLDYTWYKNQDADEDIDPKLFEAYLDLSFASFDLRLGKQIVRWGKTDEISPVDNVNPQDMREFIIRDLEGRKIPIWMAKIDYYPNDNCTIELIFIPFFKDSEVDFWERDWAFFDHLKAAIADNNLPASAKALLLQSNVVYHKPPRRLKNSEVGIRISGTVSKYDFAFSYLYTWTDMPILKSDIFQNNFSLFANEGLQTYLSQLNWAAIRDPNIHAYFNRVHIWGGELETTIGDFGVRGEVAYSKGVDFMETNFNISRHDVLFYVIGADYLSATNLYINLQFSQQIIFNYDRPIIFFRHFNNGIHGRISQELCRGKLIPEFEFYYNISDGSYYLNPELQFHYVDNWIFKLGLNILDGDRDTLFGNFDDCDQIYFYVEHDF